MFETKEMKNIGDEIIMTYEEFKEKLEKLNYNVSITLAGSVFITKEDNIHLGWISKTDRYSLDLSYEDFDNLKHKDKKFIFDLSMELASTPIKKRQL